ncbi:MAG: ABC transporter ATP-binding protein [Lachnospiraceae bacterium]
MEKKENPTSVKVSYLFQLAGKNQRMLYIAIIFSVISGLMAFVPYVMVFRTILFLFEGNGDLEDAVWYGIIALTSIVLRFIFQAVSMGMTHIGAYNLLYIVRKKLCRHIGEIGLGFFTDNSTGNIKKVLMEDVERLESFFAHQIPDITVAIAVPVTVLIYLFSLNCMMALVLMIPILITVFVQVLEMAIAKPAMKEFPKILGRCNSAIMQYVNGMPVMKAYNLTADSYEDYSNAITDYQSLWKKLAKVLAPMSGFSKVVIESGIFFMLPVGGVLFLNGNLNLSSYLFFIIMGIVFLTSYNNLLNFAQIFSQISSGLEQIKAIMDIPVITSKGQRLQASIPHTVQFENVSFSYGEKEVLKNINMELKSGTLTAFAGASGAGKTTAAQLIPRFWEVTKGMIKIDGVPIKNIAADNLMDMVSFVFQEAFMLNDSIYQNIAIGKPDCTQADVEHAAKAAQIHDFIQTLPNGYQTNIGEAGIKMSGGERQRVCIARAILKNTPIIIFDEATSFTDVENEHKIQLALDELLKGKTTIMIAHRLHTIIGADQICVFDHGEIQEKGRHEDLLLMNGQYKKMWSVYRNGGELNV